MVSRQKNLGYLLPMPYLRSGILRVLQKIIAEAFRLRRHKIIQHPRNQAGYGIHHHHGRQFSAGKHIIPDGHIIRNDLFQHPLVDPLIMAAKDHKLLLPGKLSGQLLVKDPSLGSHIYRSDRLLPSCRRLPGIINRLSLHQHACSSAVGIVIHFSVSVLRILPDIHGIDGNRPLLYSPADNAGVKPLTHHLRKQGKYMEPHNNPSRMCILINPAFTSTCSTHCLIAGRSSSLPS